MDNLTINSSVHVCRDVTFLQSYLLSPFAVLFGTCYLYTLWTFYKNIHDLKNNAYYTCLGIMGIVDIMHLLFIGITEPLLEQYIFHPVLTKCKWIIHVFLAYCQLSTTTVISVNRMTAVMLWQKYQDIFTNKYTLMFNAIAIVAAGLTVLPLTLENIGHRVVPTCFGNVFFPTKLFQAVDSFARASMIVVNLLIYFVLFCFLRYFHKSDGNSNTDIKILVQSFFIVLFHFVLWVTLLIIVAVKIYSVSVVLNICNLINSGMNPFLYFAFSTIFRKAVKKEFQWFFKPKEVTPITLVTATTT